MVGLSIRCRADGGGLARRLAAAMVLAMLPGVAWGGAEADATTPHRIVLLGARWCAPCMAELGHLPDLVRAAAPDRLVLAWIDRPIPIRGELAGQVDTMDPAEARRLAERELGEGFGLPAAIALGPAGRACRPLRGSIAAPDLAAWRRNCLVSR